MSVWEHQAKETYQFLRDSVTSNRSFLTPEKVTAIRCFRDVSSISLYGNVETSWTREMHLGSVRGGRGTFP